MQTRGLKSKQSLLLTLAMLATTLWMCLPQDIQREYDSPVQSPLPMAFPLPTYATADFDGDHLPDRAEIVSNGFQKNIHLTLSYSWATSLYFSSETLCVGSIHAEDIDRDSDNDLIWVSNQQLTHIALWLNNGIGEFTRINEPTAYAVEIERLVADESRDDLLASSVSERLRAIGTSRFLLLTRSDNHLFEVTCFTSPPIFHCSCVAGLSPCLSRYPKRGPPSPSVLV